MAGEAEEGTPMTGATGRKPLASRCPAACLPCGKSEASDTACPLPWSLTVWCVCASWGVWEGPGSSPNLTFHFHDALYSWRACSTRGAAFELFSAGDTRRGGGPNQHVCNEPHPVAWARPGVVDTGCFIACLSFTTFFWFCFSVWKFAQVSVCYCLWSCTKALLRLLFHCR